MKILIDGRLYGLENAGLGRYVMNLVGELSRLDKKNEYCLLLTKKYFEKLNLPGNWKKILADFRHYSIVEQIRLPRIVKEEKPDLTHFPHFNVPVTFSGKFIVTIHDLLMHKNVGLDATTLIPPLYFVKRLGYKTIFKKAVLDSVKIITPSEAVKKEIVDYYHVSPEKINVIYEGVDEKIGTMGEAKKVLAKYDIKNRYFIYAGNAYPHKNLRRLIEAIITLNTNYDQKVVLTIASARTIFTHRLQKEIQRFKAGNFVKLLGFVPDGDLGVLYKNSVGFVFPSISEGFGLPGLEAFACETLVLASDIPVFKEVYRDKAIYFNPYDFSSIEKALHWAMEISPEVRKTLIERGQDFVKRYSWTKMAEETLKIYESSFSLRPGK